MPKGMPGNRTFYVNPEEAKALEKKCVQESKKTGREVSEGSIIKAAFRAHLKLDK